MSEALVGKVNWAKMVSHKSNDSTQRVSRNTTPCHGTSSGWELHTELLSVLYQSFCSFDTVNIITRMATLWLHSTSSQVTFCSSEDAYQYLSSIIHDGIFWLLSNNSEGMLYILMRRKKTFGSAGLLHIPPVSFFKDKMRLFSKQGWKNTHERVKNT